MSPQEIANRKAFDKQAKEIENRMESRAPSSARRARVRANGYRGPLTRNELARQAAA